MIVEIAPAKFNRFLSVLGRRQDGFHTLELITTVLPWPSLFDELTAGIAPEWGLEIEGPASSGLLADGTNLVAKAWRLLERESGKTLPAKIALHKRIPHGAGLGGGSSDAAAALRAGNGLYRLGLPNPTLLRLAAELGSDVPLFLLGGTVLGLDLGQRVFPMRDIPLPPMLIVHPGFHVSTASVYKALNQNDLINEPIAKPAGFAIRRRRLAVRQCKRPGRPRPAAADSGATRRKQTSYENPARDGGWSGAGERLGFARSSNNAPCPSLGADEAPPWRNDLADAALTVCPELGQVRDALAGAGGDPMLCGSGSCWAARFANRADRDAALQQLSRLRPEWRFYTE